MSENTNILTELLVNRHEKIAAFIGSGVSKPLGIKTWKDVLTDMANEYKSGYDINKKLIEDNYTYPKIATEIYNAINDRDKYLNILAKQFELPPSMQYKSTHLKILTTFKTILTTNYDTSFECLMSDINNQRVIDGEQEKNIEIQKLPRFNISKLWPNYSLVYLHGNNENKTFIFREEEYKTFYPSKYKVQGIQKLEIFLRDVFLDYNLVFVGFSFDDDDFIDHFNAVVNTERQQQMESMMRLYGKIDTIKLPNYFAIILENEISTTISKEIVNNLIAPKNEKEKLFINDDANEYSFKPDAKKYIFGLSNEYARNELLRLYFNWANNNKRKRVFEELNIKPIVINNYDQIDDLLTILIKRMKVATVGVQANEI